MNRNRKTSETSQILRRFVQHAESYNRCMFPKTSSTPIDIPLNVPIHDDFLDWQSQFERLDLSSCDLKRSFSNKSLIEKDSKPSKEILVADVLSNGYRYDTSLIEFHSIQPCCLVSIVSPNAFTIQLNRDLPDWDSFFKSMNDYYNSISDLHIAKEYLRKNLPCVTWDEKTRTWNRAQVMEYDRIDDTVNLFFVDLNCWEEHLPRSRIRFILTKYSSKPVTLLTCRLASIGPIHNEEEWHDIASKTFQNVVQNYRCDVEFLHQGRDGTFYVNLFAFHDEAYVCVNDFLIHCQMARSADNISQEKYFTYQLDDDGSPMHPMIALYWKAGELMRTKEINVKKSEVDQGRVKSSTPLLASLPETNKPTLLVKAIPISTQTKIIFAKYHSYIMLPWFTISTFFGQMDDKMIKDLAEPLGFKPTIIDPLSDPLLCSQLLKLAPSRTVSSKISLYSIDCVRKLLQKYSSAPMRIYDLLQEARFAEANDDWTFWNSSDQIDHAIASIAFVIMWPKERSYSNPIYDVIRETRLSFSRPLTIDIEQHHSSTSRPPANHHNYVNQRIDEFIGDEFEENLDPLYARPRKRCITLEDDPIIIPSKAGRFSIKTIQPERAQIVSTKLPVPTVLSSNDPTDEIDEFIARENDRLERVKLRRRQHQLSASDQASLRPAPAFNNPNYVDIPIIHDPTEKKSAKSVLV